MPAAAVTLLPGPGGQSSSLRAKMSPAGRIPWALPSGEPSLHSVPTIFRASTPLSLTSSFTTLHTSAHLPCTLPSAGSPLPLPAQPVSHSVNMPPIHLPLQGSHSGSRGVCHDSPPAPRHCEGVRAGVQGQLAHIQTTLPATPCCVAWGQRLSVCDALCPHL